VATIAVTPSGTVYKGSTLSIAVDFPTGTYTEGRWGQYPYLSLFTSTDDGGSWAMIAPGVKSTSDGKLTFSYTVGNAPIWIKAGNDLAKPNTQPGTLYNGNDPLINQIFTSVVKLDPQDAPKAEIVLDQPAAAAKTFTATFTGAAFKSGQSASLQLKTIVTTMTAEVTSATWKTVATASQTSAGKATFSVSNPYEVDHTYRVMTGTSPQYTSNEVTAEVTALSSKATGVPQVYFNTNEGASVNTRTRYFEGQFKMIQANDPKYNECVSQTVNKKGNPLKAALKGRGNYSWSFDKKSFTLKLDDKVNLCGMGSSKKWAFVANHYDKSLLRNAVADYIGSKLTNIAWTPESRPVDLWLNGSYQGSYILIERIAGDTGAPRLPYDALDDNRYEKATTTPLDPQNTPGFLLEWDFRKGADKNVTVGSRGWAGIKDPENNYAKDSSASNPTGTNDGTGITTNQVNYINGYVDDCDAKLFGSNFKDDDAGWKSCIDLPSAVDYYIGMELMKPVDGNMWASVYMWKPKGGKLQMGPLWDFDLAAGSANRAGGTVNSTGWYLRNVVSTTAKQSTKTWFNRLNEDSDFTNAVKARWKVVSEDADLRGSVDEFLGTQSSKIEGSATENFKKWSVTEKLSTVQVVKGSWSKEVTYLRDWLKARVSWMNSQLD
ncbi:MAG: CotH kinase family protein, partial [Propionicimonas sp.]